MIRKLFALLSLSFIIGLIQAQELLDVRPKALNIASRLELFVDDYLIDELKGSAQLILHEPVPKEVVIVHDEPWEGNATSYHSIFKDGDTFKMFYRGGHIGGNSGKFHHKNLCYAESKDGINWTKPVLNLCEFNGSTNNNIVVISYGKEKEYEGMYVTWSGGFFKDTNPAVREDELYKGLVILHGGKGPVHNKGLLAVKSPDGKHWSLLSNNPVIEKDDGGFFDSQNLAFWDAERQEYRIYWRHGQDGTRLIRTAVSKDFIHWHGHTDVNYIDSPIEELYHFPIKPYYRAPHIYVGFPSRYVEKDRFRFSQKESYEPLENLTSSLNALPGYEGRMTRMKFSQRYGTALTDGLFMASRDGAHFKKWNRVFLRPGIERVGSWTYGDGFVGWHLIETTSEFEGAPNELSIYAVENYWIGDEGTKLRRYTMRVDGFVSVNADMNGGELITKPILFEGDDLYINFSTSAAGEVRVEVLEENGFIPIQGFEAINCFPVFGDSVERRVEWKRGEGETMSLSTINKPVRLRFVLKDADLYSFRFK
ncbi:hypothetical protein [Parapedobacter soli]|uniref:hypothetical protein n=1 Tax=Parapedobacter soli TaxID=416955 RepID=UPI0021C9F458|nr:hypothetical protein [Parapedobacter soli]